MLPLLAQRVGDPATEEGRRLLTERSPLWCVGEIKRRLLIGQGANDPRVKQTESDQIVAAMRERGIPVTYVLYPDEGHGFARPENRLSFMAVAEAFLAPLLGGRAEPFGDDLDRGGQGWRRVRPRPPGRDALGDGAVELRCKTVDAVKALLPP